MTAEDDVRALIELQLDAVMGAVEFRKKVAAAVRDAMNRAAAAVLFDKPMAAVSAAEMAAAGGADYVVVGDRPKSDRVRRAAHVAALQCSRTTGCFRRRWPTTSPTFSPSSTRAQSKDTPVRPQSSTAAMARYGSIRSPLPLLKK